VVGYQFWLRLGDILELVAQDPRDHFMQLPPPAFQQSVIGGVLHQRMLEAIAGLRRHALDVNKVRLGQPFKTYCQCGVAVAGNRSYERIIKFTTEHRRDLRDFLGRSQSIEPRGQQRL
jgi:hypothetical protein